MGKLEELQKKLVENIAASLEQKNNASMTQEKIVVFLDLLGFSVAVRDNIQVAASKIDNYNSIIDEQFGDQQIHPVDSYCTELQSLAESSYATTFDYFLPASDSVFIVSDKENLNVFVKQLCSFLLKSYTLTASRYAYPEDKDEVTLHKGRNININEKDVKLNDEIYSPCLFRGGMSIGVCDPFPQYRVVNGKILNDNCNLIGEAVVDAVHLEGIVNGPRVLIEEKYYNMCEEDVKRHYFRQLSDNEIKDEYKNIQDENGNKIILYELLWPVALFIRRNGIISEIRNNGNLRELIQGSYNLYKSKSNKGAEQHYKAFIDLLYNSILIYWDNASAAKEYVEKMKMYDIDK